MSESVNITYKYVADLEGFIKSIFKKESRYADSTVKLFLYIQQHQKGEQPNKDLMEVAKELDIEYGEFNYILRKLKRLGILQNKRGVLLFSKLFILRLTRIIDFYSKFSNQLNPWQEMLNQANEYIQFKLGKASPVFEVKIEEVEEVI